MKKSLIALAALAAMGDVAFGSARKSCDDSHGHENRAFGLNEANVDSATLNDNTFMQAFGNTTTNTGVLALTANPTAADVLRIMLIPAGTRVDEIVVASDDLDSNGSPTFVVSIGYAYVDGSSASAAYFAAAGQTFPETGSNGAVFRKFAPITFEKDAYLTMTVGTAAATFAAGSIYVSARGIARGIK
jgi:hypothetical protein